jgi:hypothetical protein
MNQGIGLITNDNVQNTKTPRHHRKPNLLTIDN